MAEWQTHYLEVVAPKGVEVRLLSRALMNIRKFSLNDIEQILEMSRASFAEPWPKSEFEKYLDGSFVAEGDGKIAGFIVGKVREGKGILKLVAVNPDFRGKGVGKELMEYIFQYFAENEAKEHGKKYIYLGSSQRPADTYKLQFAGLEWFDGKMWQTDLEKLKKTL